MKQLSKFILIVILTCWQMSVYADDSKSNSGGKEPDPVIIPIDLSHEKGGPITYAPSKVIEGYVVVNGESIGFIFPFMSYPAIVEISCEDPLPVYWSMTLETESDVMPFKAALGNYQLNILTSSGRYIGHFTIE